MTVQRDQQVGNSSLLNTSCGFNRVPHKGGPKLQLSVIIDQAWSKNAKKCKISKHSKQWQTEDCSRSLDNYRASRSLENWKKFKKVVKDIKRFFFDDKIQEIANKSCSPQELMNWIKKRKLSAIEAINYDGHPCLTPNSLWNALHNIFNNTLNH